MLEQRLDLGCEQEVVADLGVVDRLDAVAVAGQHELAARSVPDGEGEHAVQSLERSKAPFLVGAQHDLGVRARAESVPDGLELPPQLAEVVDLPVEREHDPALVGHRLVSRRGQVDDGQAAVTKADRARHPCPFVVRPAMSDFSRHRRDELLRRGCAARVQDAGDPAHNR